MIALKGIRIKQFIVQRAAEDGKNKIQATYELVSTKDTVLASKSITSGSDYGEEPFTPSPQTIAAIRSAIELYQKDLELSLGFNE